MPPTKRQWPLSQRTPILRKRPGWWLITIGLLLVFYGAMTVFLALSRQDLKLERPADWRLSPLQQSIEMQTLERSSEPFLQPLSRPWIGTTVRNLSTDTTTLYIPSFGFVMKDFASRVLSRHISSSNVLVVSMDATQAANEGIGILNKVKVNNQTASHYYTAFDAQSPFSIGGTFLLHAAMEGHDIHAIDFGREKNGKNIEWEQTLDEWWTSFDDDNNNNNGGSSPKAGMRRWSSSDTKPKWILAAIFDHFRPDNLELSDQVWNGADRFLTESTMTYVVVAMHSRKVGGKYQYGGLVAAKNLLNHRYKLQTLLLSHYHTDPGKEASTEEKYGPNAIFKSIDNVQDLLRWGADVAERFETRSYNKVFTAYIFATQGLDLAIPSNRIFIDDSSRVIGTESTLQINLYKPLQFKRCPQANMDRKLDIAFSEVGLITRLLYRNYKSQIAHHPS